MIEVYRYAQRPTRFVTFGQESPYPLVEKDLKRAAARLPEDVSEVLGRLVLDLLDAQRWADLAWRDVPMDLRARVAARLDLGRGGGGRARLRARDRRRAPPLGRGEPVVRGA